MFKSGRSGGWKCFVPNSESAEAAAAQYAAAHKGGKTDVSRGMWEAAILDSLVGDEGAAHRGVAIQQDTSHVERYAPTSALRASAPLSLPRGFVNSAVVDNVAIRNTRCFAIATAQALFARAGVKRFLRAHSAAHTRKEATCASVDTSNCYACAMGQAMELVYSAGRAPIAPEEHSMWSGGAVGAPCIPSSR